MARAILGKNSLKGAARSRIQPGRFDRTGIEAVDDGWARDDDAPESIATSVQPERAKGVLTTNDSPDVGFDQSINPYRGCEHGCIYCYARPSHAYMGLSAGLDFETRLFYKADAAAVLEQELSHPRYVCRPVMIGANTDPYQPIERRLKVTRSLLEVLAKYRHPVSIITKGVLIARDIDLLADLAKDDLTSVIISITTLDAEVKRTLEPRAASPQARLKVVRQLADAGRAGQRAGRADRSRDHGSRDGKHSRSSGRSGCACRPATCCCVFRTK